jgi:hypothetical protein
LVALAHHAECGQGIDRLVDEALRIERVEGAMS